MKSQFENQCGKKELLVAYLYAEASPAECKEFERHQAVCAECRTELQAFKGVRQELGTWEMPFIPHIEVVTPRTAIDALRDFFRLVPGWFKITSGLATIGVAALVILALTGTQLSFGNGTATFGGKELAQANSEKSAASTPVPANFLSREEAEKMIQTAVAQAQADARAHTQTQLANLEARLNAAHQTELQNATMRLRKDHQKQLLAQLAKLDGNQRQSLTEWLLTSDATENQGEVSNEKNQ